MSSAIVSRRKKSARQGSEVGWMSHKLVGSEAVLSKGDSGMLLTATNSKGEFASGDKACNETAPEGGQGGGGDVGVLAPHLQLIIPPLVLVGAQLGALAIQEGRLKRKKWT
jgi:hypothetical protein